ncbi:Bax inhibitor-1/YccA family protein [Dactylosporangium roseum]|uniref:Bax inhibitor-1/YccA family protein n=1 Tax=Dactylosporangium roseum TaxID=47989 RepID=A0ABY5Z4H2_9ACTN|nr:Bax inhibitor-1/YccA family protein [Dactylosporangium roseum]UWZ35940.1 Bax inhibitor-1/YccA family protein [Dactylosporangium roseum]
MQSSNPVLTRLGEAARQERSSVAGYGTGYAPGYPPQAAPRTMTLDDVVVRTVALLAITGIVGAGAWVLLPAGSAATAIALIGSVVAGLVLGLVIAFARVTNPAVIIAYAALQGVALGLFSRQYESFYDGIVIQAVIGTFGIFAVMAVLYKLRVLRATPRFTKMVVGALIGVVVLSLANFLFYLFDVNLGLREYSATGKVGWLPIVFSLVVVVVAALTFILDFDAVEQGVRYGLPEKYAWYCSFGILVGLIFLYYEILRLLSYLRR